MCQHWWPCDICPGPFVRGEYLGINKAERAVHKHYCGANLRADSALERITDIQTANLLLPSDNKRGKGIAIYAHPEGDETPFGCPKKKRRYPRTWEILDGIEEARKHEAKLSPVEYIEWWQRYAKGTVAAWLGYCEPTRPNEGPVEEFDKTRRVSFNEALADFEDRLSRHLQSSVPLRACVFQKSTPNVCRPLTMAEALKSLGKDPTQRDIEQAQKIFLCAHAAHLNWRDATVAIERIQVSCLTADDIERYSTLEGDRLAPKEVGLWLSLFDPRKSETPTRGEDLYSILCNAQPRRTGVGRWKRLVGIEHGLWGIQGQFSDFGAESYSLVQTTIDPVSCGGLRLPGRVVSRGSAQEEEITELILSRALDVWIYLNRRAVAKCRQRNLPIKFWVLPLWHELLAAVLEREAIKNLARLSTPDRCPHGVYSREVCAHCLRLPEQNLGIWEEETEALIALDRVDAEVLVDANSEEISLAEDELDVSKEKPWDEEQDSEEVEDEATEEVLKEPDADEGESSDADPDEEIGSGETPGIAPSFIHIKAKHLIRDYEAWKRHDGFRPKVTDWDEKALVPEKWVWGDKALHPERRVGADLWMSFWIGCREQGADKSPRHGITWDYLQTVRRQLGLTEKIGQPRPCGELDAESVENPRAVGLERKRFRPREALWDRHKYTRRGPDKLPIDRFGDYLSDLEATREIATCPPVIKVGWRGVPGENKFGPQQWWYHGWLAQDRNGPVVVFRVAPAIGECQPVSIPSPPVDGKQTGHFCTHVTYRGIDRPQVAFLPVLPDSQIHTP